MPELPEVEVARRQLARWTADRPIVGVHAPDAAVVRRSLSSKPSDVLAGGVERLQGLVGHVPSEPVRHGKRLGWVVGDVGLLAHFGMTAHLVRRPVGEQPDQARLGIEVADAVIWFVDGRRFGCVTPVSVAELDERLRAGCGPDALLEPLDGPGMRAVFRGKKAIKVALMDQVKLAGLGNIHAAEACFRARIDPATPCSSLGSEDWERLADAVLAQLRETVVAEDVDEDMVYVNLGGPNPFSVYRREGEGCAACGTVIRAAEMGGRTTYWCPGCQPARDAAPGVG
ncbi:MAG: Fpg/Nei family DNA glycosylase [Myxococcales bacterium]|nr:Fpg/Nei family DNA glycosylase [Myxococcales bacterium]